METRLYRPYLTVLGLMTLTALALAFTVDVRISDVAGVKTELPERVGGWTGEELLFCQVPTCQKDFGAHALTNRLACPACGGKLMGLSFIEARLLPRDTVVVKRRYTNSARQVLFASIVLSGRERASIHRPETCLVGQGSEIVNQSVLQVPIEGRPALRVKVLDMIHRSDPAAPAARSYYAYWFVGQDRETPEHWQRMWWMATDRVLRNRSHRWAYLSVGAGRPEDSTTYLEEVRGFIRDFYPQMLPDGRGSPDGVGT